MMTEAIRSKWFIGFIVIVAIIGGIIGFIGGEMHEKKIKNAEEIELKDFNKPDRLYITGIEDTMLGEEYINFEKDTTYPKAIEFDFGTIKTDKKIYALDWTRDSLLVLVGRQNSSPTTVDPRWTELWVWGKHIRKKN